MTGEWDMADKGGMDIVEHKKTWDTFMKMTMWCTVLVVITLILLGIGLLPSPPRLK